MTKDIDSNLDRYITEKVKQEFNLALLKSQIHIAIKLACEFEQQHIVASLHEALNEIMEK